MEEIYLSKYLPVSELKVKQHKIKLPRYPVIDMHMHWGKLVFGEDYASQYETVEKVNALKEVGIQAVVNLDGLYEKVLDRMLAKTNGFHDFILTFGSVDYTKLDERNFEKYVQDTIGESVKKGIRGLKFLKNLSLSDKDSHNRYIPVDDPRLQVIWSTAAEYGLPVLIHIADPVAFFKPINAENERFEELSRHSEWSFYGDQFFSFHDLMEMQQNLLKNNPKTTFIIPHVGSHPENLEFVKNCLEQYPNLIIDIADRIAELGRQPYTAREFMIQYRDRILFGTDSTPIMPFEKRYPIYYRFLETYDEYFNYSYLPAPPQGRWKIYGLGLDDETLRRIYYKNARELLKI